MQISSNQPMTINFTSRNNPVAPFLINTPKGKLHIKEFKEIDANSTKKMKNLAKFFFRFIY